MNKKKQILKILNEWEQDFKVFGRNLPFEIENLEKARLYAINLCIHSPLNEIQQEAEEFLDLTKNLTQKEYKKFFT
jgi:hypothetical protein